MGKYDDFTLDQLKEVIKDLEEELLFLRALEAAGVDNWDGYDYAIEIRESW